MDPEERMTPTQGLAHPFITGQKMAPMSQIAAESKEDDLVAEMEYDSESETLMKQMPNFDAKDLYLYHS